jgi:hypothetical protein
MGFLGSDYSVSPENESNPTYSAGNSPEERIDREIRGNALELETKKQNLYRTRLDIIKGQGGQQWTPNYASPLPPGRGGSFV